MPSKIYLDAKAVPRKRWQLLRRRCVLRLHEARVSGQLFSVADSSVHKSKFRFALKSPALRFISVITMSLARFFDALLFRNIMEHDGDATRRASIEKKLNVCFRKYGYR